MASYEVTVDTRKGPWVGDPVRVRVGDVGSCVIVAHVTEGGTEHDLTGLSAQFMCCKPDGTVVQDKACAVDGSTITHTLATQVAQYAGECAAAYFSIFNEAGTLIDSTQSFALVVEDSAGSAGVSTDYISDINTLMALLETQKQKYAAAEAAREEAEEGRDTAEEARVAAEEARATVEEGRAEAESARVTAEKARAAAETKRGDAEAARASAEAQRQSNEAERQSAETSRQEAESGRQSAESTRAEAEAARASAESARATAEGERADAEAARAKAESARATAEDARDTAEAERVANEKQRIANEDARKTAEAARADAESARGTAEAARADAESARATAETARAAAEETRAGEQTQNNTDQAKNNADQAANNAAALGMTFVIVQSGQYDETTLEPTFDGANGKMYLVPDPDGSADNVYREWIWANSAWECIGSSATSFDAITTDTIDSIAAGGSASGDEGLSTTGLTYLWAKLKAAFAAVTHTHAVADITDFPKSMPASDVSAWAKAATKPAYTASEVGAAATGHTHAVADVSGLQTALDAKQARSTYAAVSIAVADWADNACTKSVEGMTADAVVTVAAAPASEVAASEAHVYCTAQGAGTLTFACVDAPEAAITLNVEFKEA